MNKFTSNYEYSDGLNALFLQPENSYIGEDSIIMENKDQITKITICVAGDVEIRLNSFASFPQLQTLIFDVDMYGPTATLKFIEGSLNGLNNLHTLQINDCGVTEILPNLFSQMPLLNYLSVGRNNIDSIKLNSFNNLPNLQTLDLSSNMINDIEERSFNGLNVTELNLSENDLEKINGRMFEGLNANTIINLSDNIIFIVEDGSFDNMINTVDLTNNLMTVDVRNALTTDNFINNSSSNEIKFRNRLLKNGINFLSDAISLNDLITSYDNLNKLKLQLRGKYESDVEFKSLSDMYDATKMREISPISLPTIIRSKDYKLQTLAERIQILMTCSHDQISLNNLLLLKFNELKGHCKDILSLNSIKKFQIDSLVSDVVKYTGEFLGMHHTEPSLQNGGAKIVKINFNKLRFV